MRTIVDHWIPSLRHLRIVLVRGHELSVPSIASPAMVREVDMAQKLHFSTSRNEGHYGWVTHMIGGQGQFDILKEEMAVSIDCVGLQIE